VLFLSFYLFHPVFGYREGVFELRRPCPFQPVFGHGWPGGRGPNGGAEGHISEKTEGIEGVCLTARALAHIHIVPYNQR
jgi:hypothetical protein